MALKPNADTIPLVEIYNHQRVEKRGDNVEGWLWSWLELSLVQILVEVANTKVRFFWADEDKGFLVKANCQKLVGPKRRLNSY